MFHYNIYTMMFTHCTSYIKTIPDSSFNVNYNLKTILDQTTDSVTI